MIDLDDIFSKLSEPQREAVFSDVNTVVSAGAGAGKTMVLSRRFLRIVAERKADVDQILTLTFTNKAAAEMNERIHGVLIDSCGDDEYMKNQLSKFPKASICTLDSFCSQVVRMDCIRYGIPVDFSMDDDRNTSDARKLASSFLDREDISDGFRWLAKAYDPDELVDGFLVPMAAGCFYISRKRERTDVLDHIRKSFKEDIDNIWMLLSSVRDWRENSGKELNALLECINEGRYLEGLQDHGNIRKSTMRTDTKEEYNEVIEQFRKLRPYALEKALFISQHESDPSLLDSIDDAIGQFEDAYISEKRRSGILTFSDVSHLAVHILEHNRDVRRYFKEKFRYIMIDEFQDNNSLQKDMLYLLAEKLGHEGEGVPSADQLEKEKLFFVGDEKQSIYRFRGADVSVFKMLSDELAASGGKSIVLGTNYRTEPQLIELFNSMFEHIMKNDGENYEADFEPLGTRDPKEGITPPTCSIYIKPYDRDSDIEEKASASLVEAEAICNQISQMVGNVMIDDNGPRPLEYRDIALLLPKATNQMDYERCFRLHGIPYRVTESRSYTLESIANDIYCVLQLLIYPDDRLAYASALRSPFANLSDESILACLDGKEINDPEEKSRYELFITMMEDLHKRAAMSSTAVLVSALWHDWGLCYRVLEKRNQPFLDQYDFLYDLACRFDENGKNLVAFLDELRPRLGSSQRDDGSRDIFTSLTDGVSIMTIHKSKGLEFPVVIVSSLGTGSSNRESSWICHEDQISVRNYKASDGKFRNIYAKMLRETEKETAELRRVLYVALTRCINHLIITGSYTKTNQHSDNMLNMVVSSLGIDFADGDDIKIGDIVECHRIHDMDSSYFDAISTQTEKTDMEGVGRFYSETPDDDFDLSSSKCGVTSMFEVDETDGELLDELECDAFINRHELYADFGTMSHNLLEARLLGGDVSFRAAATDRLRSLNEDERKLLYDGAWQLSDNFLHSELYERYVKGNRISCEVRFFRPYEDRVLEGSMDLLIETDDMNYVVDFKTDRTYEKNRHNRQITFYRDAAEDMFKKKCRCCVCYLRRMGGEIWL